MICLSMYISIFPCHCSKIHTDHCNNRGTGPRHDPVLNIYSSDLDEILYPHKNPERSRRKRKKPTKGNYYMRILCDVCERDEASVFCVADEAALCLACDRRVHHANKLAGKHHRYSLHHPSSKQAPLCDICKERGAFLFCQQDRAILCRDCDISIHRANELTQMHDRFLLTCLGISSAESSQKKISDSVLGKFNSKSVISPTNIAPSRSVSTTLQSSAAAHSGYKSNGNLINGSVSGSKISEYLIETPPGWRLEDLLDSSFPGSYGFSEEGNNELMLPLMGADFPSNLSSFPPQKMGCVPQVALLPPMNQTLPYRSIEHAIGTTTGTTREQQFRDLNIVDGMKSSRKWSEDSCFLVPQINSPLTASKKQKTFR